MLELLSSGLLSLWLDQAGITPAHFNPLSLVSAPAIPGFVLATDPEPATSAKLQQYLQDLEKNKLAKNAQGLWLQSGSILLAANQGTVPLPAASLTKVATSIASLETWGPNHQFLTIISATGPIQDGVLQGDLVVTGGDDPLFIWEEAFAVANALNKMGIKRVTGNLIIDGNFYLNFQPDPAKSGEELKQSFDSNLWQEEAQFVYSTLPENTPKPKLEIDGSVKLGQAKGKPLLRHVSIPLRDILKQMNVHSNNEIAQMLADAMGGTKVVKERAVKAAGVPPEEILLINGSGLGQENRISPRAVCAMFIALQRYLYPYNLTIGDLFPVSGLDVGTLEDRHVPAASVVKTGTLSDVSALAGVLPTREHGLVWFAIINRGQDIDGLRAKQDTFLQALQKQLGTPPFPLTAIAPKLSHDEENIRLGAADRNEILIGG